MPLLGQFADASWAQVIGGVAVAYIAYGVLLAVYRLYLSPLSKFPAPKLAALTLWYEFYYDVLLKGRFAWEIKRMHEVYGKSQLLDQHT